MKLSPVIGVCLVSLSLGSVRAQTIEWYQALGTSGTGSRTARDVAGGVAVNATGVYVVGFTEGTFPGQTLSGPTGTVDAFVRRYDSSGNDVWTHQFGNGVSATATAAVADSTGVYVVGHSLSTLPGLEWIGLGDAFIRKYDPSGNEVWTQGIGSAGYDEAWGVAVADSGVYIVGSANGTIPGQTRAGGRDAYIRKYDFNGGELWTRQFGSARTDTAYGVAITDEGVYVAGQWNFDSPQFGTGEAFIAKYDAAGNPRWIRQFGSSIVDSPVELAAGANGVYVVGTTSGVLAGQISSGSRDGFVRKYDFSGNEQWTHQFGTGASDMANAVAAGAGGVYIAGWTMGVFPGQASLGGEDVFLLTYAADGTEKRDLQFGSFGNDSGLAVTAHGPSVYVVGWDGSRDFPGNSGGLDAFIAKLSQPSPPATIYDGGVVNNASYAAHPAPLAPGSIAAVFGTSLNNGSEILSSSFGSDGRLVLTLGGASVRVNGIPAPLFYSTSSQLGIQIPFEVAGQTSATIEVQVGEQTTAQGNVSLAEFAPGIFTLTQDGRGAAAVLHEDGITPVTAESPARPGDIVVLFATGLGAVTPPLTTGEPSSGNQTVTLAFATIDGLPAEVLFSGAAPGFVGLYQINFRVPANIRSGNVPLVLSIGSVSSNTVTIAIQ